VTESRSADADKYFRKSRKFKNIYVFFALEGYQPRALKERKQPRASILKLNTSEKNTIALRNQEMG
jgi:hypothetical protein